ncbi:serine/threonine protein kinase [Bradymonas sediminis]|uniref:Uncharacterized protein n=1 Tax=Bradymonas sediminis TaxID=1548548 RepID=A0A2Z4FK25_9DELT|nr:serine/threonine-protein kinase [Bradymonas sediminis]AWV89302.1 hypothetical protein DN745_08110 [Bradymonas sediminis]TDP73476.1 serine/threonine protein kinase [Bradymonas sediminis]
MPNNIEIGDTLLGKYRIEREVGAGSFGAVFSAIDLDTGERVAIKALPEQGHMIGETQIARFRREMKIISALVHRNIIGIYDFGQTSSGLLFMVLEYVDGQPLNVVMEQGPIDPIKVVSICEQIASALLLAHHRGIIHRDLKPANIMLAPERDDYLVKVLDFGTAKLLKQLDDAPLEELTREGMAVGTPRYIAPEQARGQNVGPWSDLYALGLLMYEMLTGERAVKADDVEGAVSAHVSPHPLQLAEIHLVPTPFRPVLARLIEKDASKRYRSADQVLEELNAMRFQLEDAMGGSVPHLDPVRAQLHHQPGFSAPALGDPGRPPPGSPAAAQRARAEQIIADAQNPPSIDVDWKKQQRHQGASSAQAFQKTGRDAPVEDFFRTPDTPLEWAEACIAPLIALFCFILLGAQLYKYDFAIRLLLGLIPMIAALAWSILSARGSWRYSFFRLWILFSLAAALVAHAMGPDDLIRELYRSSTWFLEPLRGLPGIDTLGAVLGWVMRWYAKLLDSVLQWGMDVIR